MKKIYVLTEEINYDGCPSKDIAGIFNDRQSAQKFLDSFDNSECGNTRIEEYILNPFQAELEQGFKCYFLRMKKDGTPFDSEIATFPPNTCLDLNPGWFTRFGFDVLGNLYCHTYASDENHAIRICNKERLKIISQGRWPENLLTY